MAAAKQISNNIFFWFTLAIARSYFIYLTSLFNKRICRVRDLQTTGFIVHRTQNLVAQIHMWEYHTFSVK